MAEGARGWGMRGIAVAPEDAAQAALVERPRGGADRARRRSCASWARGDRAPPAAPSRRSREDDAPGPRRPARPAGAAALPRDRGGRRPQPAADRAARAAARRWRAAAALPAAAARPGGGARGDPDRRRLRRERRAPAAAGRSGLRTTRSPAARWSAGDAAAARGGDAGSPRRPLPRRARRVPPRGAGGAGSAARGGGGDARAAPGTRLAALPVHARRRLESVSLRERAGLRRVRLPARRGRPLPGEAERRARRPDRHLRLGRAAAAPRADRGEEAEGSAAVRERVLRRRRVQEERLGEGRTNAEMAPAEVRRHCGLDAPARAALEDGHRSWGSAAAAGTGCLRVARTIADLAGEERRRGARRRGARPPAPGGAVSGPARPRACRRACAGPGWSARSRGHIENAVDRTAPGQPGAGAARAPERASWRGRWRAEARPAGPGARRGAGPRAAAGAGRGGAGAGPAAAHDERYPRALRELGEAPAVALRPRRPGLLAGARAAGRR